MPIFDGDHAGVSRGFCDAANGDRSGEYAVASVTRKWPAVAERRAVANGVVPAVATAVGGGSGEWEDAGGFATG